MHATRIIPMVLLALAPGCHDDGPTAPLRVSPTPAPPALDLAGTWAGTVRDRGRTDAYFCPGRSAEVSFSIVQTGASIRFDLPPVSGCSALGPETFDGSLTETGLSGSLRKETEPCLLTGSARGSVAAGHLELDGNLAGECNDLLVHLEASRQ